jgi:hypothetical protein
VRSLYCLIALLLAGQVQAESRFSGYLKNYSLIQDEIDFSGFQADKIYSSQFSGRAMLDMLGESFSIQVHYELGRDFNSDESGLNIAAPGRNSYRLTDITSTPGENNLKSVNRQNLDRLNIQFSLEAGDLTVGRQPITFGSARIINPTDVFLPFDVQTLNTEYRAGIDAIRFQRPVGQLSELDLGVVLGDDASNNSAAFARLKSNLGGSDLELTLIRFSEQNLIGIGIESTLGQFGTWLEAASVTGDESYVRGSIGLDYGFGGSWFGMLEYHYNGAGAEQPKDYLNRIESTPFRAGGVFLLGKHYLIPSLNWQISPLTTASLQLLRNLKDGSMFVNLAADFSLHENLYLGISYFGFSGDEPTLPNLASEYGANPDRLIINLRYYF